MYRKIITVKTVPLYKILYFFLLKVLNQEKEAGTNFNLFCQSRNMIEQLKKAYLNRPSKILHFLTTARIRKCLT